MLRLKEIAVKLKKENEMKQQKSQQVKNSAMENGGETADLLCL